ncbi:MAG: hypothetical protein RIS35_1022 [Pseudomonadota bacterium]
MSSKKWMGVLVIVVGMVVGAWALRPAPLEVDVASVGLGPMRVTVEDVGETRSHDRFVLSAPVAGRLARIELREGDAVAAGDVVARITALPLSVRESDELEARLSAARALEREADRRALGAEAQLAHARRELERVRRLVRDGFVSSQAADEAIRAETAAATELEAARHRARAARSDAEAVAAGLRAVRPGAGAPSPVLVRSPSAGRILRIEDPSERVVAPGAPLMSIGDLSRLEVVVELLSSEAVRVTPGMPALLEGWGGDEALRAVVRRVEPYAVTKVSALGIEEKRVDVILDFVDPPGPLGDGYRVTARIVTWASDQVLRVPVSALFRCDREWCVFAVEDGRARRRIVGLGHRNAAEAEIVSGLSAGERVIRFPVNALEDGTRVQPRP